MNIRALFVCICICVLLPVVFVVLSRRETLSTADTATPVGKRSVYIGAWAGGFWDNDTKTLTTDKLADFEKTIGRSVAIATIYSEWSYLSHPELIDHLHVIAEHGWVPLISANPFFFEQCPDTGKPLYAAIAQGGCDEFLRLAGLNLRSYRKPVFLRFAWEMNLPDMYWSIAKTGSTPSDFVQAWQRFHDILTKEQADNVVWVLSFNTSHPGTVPYRELYPGDPYVDWVAIDGYNWGDSHPWAGWASFSGVFLKSYRELTALTDKPLMLSEVNSAPTGGDKAAWLSDMLETQIPTEFPRIEAVIFFNENKSAGESVDWRLEKDDRYIQAVQKGLNHPLYKSSFP